ncbi:MAG: hypothetical protein JSW33_13605, partial [bacterium]
PNVLGSLDGVSNDGGNIDLVAGSNVTITPDDGANTITISATGGGTGDNLGNHTATQNINLNGNWLSGDGENEGVWIANNGDVGVGISSPTSTLDVSGAIRATRMITENASQANGEGDIIANDDLIADDQVRAYGESSTNYVVYGEHNNGNYGFLGGSSEGVYGENSDGDNGSLGDNLFGGAVAFYRNGNRGILGGPSVGVSGYVPNNNIDNTYGVHGEVLNPNSYGVYGTSLSLTGGRGVHGQASASNGIGVYGQAPGTSWAGYFAGHLNITGSIVKAGGSFKIDHPLDPTNKNLYHSFVESPDMMNIYNGNVITDSNGDATIELPEWFEALNKDFRYQLTVIGEFAQTIISQKIANNHFSIKTDKPNIEVSWQVTGIRQDAYANANRIPVEEMKKPEEQGKYLHPQAFGLPETIGVDYDEEFEKMIIRREQQEAEYERSRIEKRQRIEQERLRLDDQRQLK